MNHRLLSLLTILVLTVPALAKDKGKPKPADSTKHTTPITLADCPPAVQSVIQAYNGTVTGIETEEENGVTNYDAKITLPDGKRLKVLLAKDGTLLESKDKKAK